MPECDEWLRRSSKRTLETELHTVGIKLGKLHSTITIQWAGKSAAYIFFTQKMKVVVGQSDVTRQIPASVSRELHTSIALTNSTVPLHDLSSSILKHTSCFHSIKITLLVQILRAWRSESSESSGAK